MALSDYLTNLGVDQSMLNDSICSVMPSKFFHNSNVVRSLVVIPKATEQSKYMIMRLSNGKHIKSIKELMYNPMSSCNNIVLDLNVDVVNV